MKTEKEKEKSEQSVFRRACFFFFATDFSRYSAGYDDPAIHITSAQYFFSTNETELGLVIVNRDGNLG